VLRALAPDWHRLAPLLAEGQLGLLQRFELVLGSGTPSLPAAATSRRVLRRALHELAESIEYFNKRWSAFLQGFDLGPLNALRDGYNRYYLLEKECAIGSARIARQGFVVLPPLAVDDLKKCFPLLPVPRLKP
jgi:hypothetical protein